MKEVHPHRNWIIKKLEEYRRYMGISRGFFDPWYTDPSLLAEWVIENYGRSENTLRLYKRRLCDYAKEIGYPDVAEELSKLIGAAYMKERPKKGIKEIESRITDVVSTGDKGYDVSQLEPRHIYAFMIECRSKFRSGRPRHSYGKSISELFSFLSMTGMRPSELCGSVYVRNLKLKDRPGLIDHALVVRNALKGNADNRTPFRYLSISHWDDDEIERVKSLLGMIGDSYPHPQEVLPSEFDHESGAIIAGAYIADGDSEFIEAFKMYVKAQSVYFGRISQKALGNKTVMTLYSARHLYAAEFRRCYKCDRTTLADALGHTDTVSQKFYGDSFDSQEERKFNWSLAIPVGVGVKRIEASRSKRKVMSLARLISSLSDKPISDSLLDNLLAYQADPSQIIDLLPDHIAERIGSRLTDRANESVASEKLKLS